MTDILMPKLSDSMEEGMLLTWLKQAGEAVAAGEELLEIETDKSTVTYSAEVAGILEILVSEGSTVPVGEPIARVTDSPAETNTHAEPPKPSTAISSGPDTEPEEVRTDSEHALNSSAHLATDADPERLDRPSNKVATPLARRTAEVHRVSLTEVTGTGPLGRITRSDVLRFAGLEPLASPQSSAAPAREAVAPLSSTVPAAQALGSSASSRQEPTRLQQVIARRMAEAKATIPHFQVQTEVLMSGSIALRAELKAVAGENDAVPSFNDFVIKASAAALRDHPLANGSYADGGFELHDRINVGMAVAADGALVVPVVLDADEKSLGRIAQETRALASRVRDGTIAPPELSGGTFTVSNLGMFGMTAITPVINPPQAAILGVGAMRNELAMQAGEIVEQTRMTLTLSCDHRILYGADAARFLARIRDLLQNPLKLAL